MESDKNNMASLLSMAVAFQLNPNNTAKLNHCHATATFFLSAGKGGGCFCTTGYSAWADSFHSLLESTMQFWGSRDGRDCSDV